MKNLAALMQSKSVAAMVGMIMLAALLEGNAAVARAAGWSWEGGLLATARTRNSATLLQNGKVLAAGGQSASMEPHAFASAELYDPGANSWSEAAPMAAARRNHSGTLLPSGKVLVSGGGDPENGTFASCELYDPMADSWSPGAAMSIGRTYHSATLLPGGKVLVAGGYNDNFLDSAELYDPAGDSWSPAGSMGPGRIRHSATLLPSGKVLIAGGWGTDGSLAAAVLYDPVSNAWSEAAPLAIARNGHSATLLLSGKVLVAGGQVGPEFSTDSWLDSAELYDPATDSWSMASSLADTRSDHSATLLPTGQVLVVAGYGGDPFTPYADCPELYDPATDSWGDAGPICVQGRVSHTSILLPSGKVLVTTGETGDGFPYDTSYLYEPATDRWSTTDSWGRADSLKTSRDRHSATLLPTGKVLVAGGWSEEEKIPTATAELYDPAANQWNDAASLASARTEHSATLLTLGKVLVVGGRGGDPLATAELYDIAGNAWSATASLRNARYEHSATLLPSGKVLVAGGYSDGYLASAELYDPATESWSAAGTMATGRYGHSATLLASGKVLLAGGIGEGGHLATVELYDPATNSWSAAGSLATARLNHSATLLPGGKVLAAGGENDEGFLVSAELYDPASNAWSQADSLATARARHSATLLPSGKVLVTAGLGDLSSQFGGPFDAELYDPGTDNWYEAGSLATARSFHSATLLSSGKVLVAAGHINDGDFASALLYEPGLGFSDSGRPVITGITNSGDKLTIRGSGFRGVSEGSSGGTYSVSTNYPLLQLIRLDNEQSLFVDPDPSAFWSDTSFRTGPISSLPAGYYRASIYVNAIPSLSRVILIGASSGPPVLATHFAVSAPASVTAGSPFDFTVTALDAGNAVTDYRGTVTFASSDAAATLPANLTLNNGVATASATLRSSGTQTISASDITASITGTSRGIVVQVPDLTITKSHKGNFKQGQSGATYSITATNSGSAPTTGTVTVTDTLPGGLQATGISGCGWTCTLATLTCTRSSVLAAGSSYAPITVTVNVARNASRLVTNTASISGGGQVDNGNDSASDPTTVLARRKYPSGNVKDGVSAPTIADALKVMQFALGLATPTAEQAENVDVAPIVRGEPMPDGVVDGGDALVVLEKIVGTLAW